MSDGMSEELWELSNAEPVSANMVNHPPHYTHGKWEVIEVLEEFFEQDPLLWQVGKYILRCEHKGATVRDLEKAKWYLERKINKLKELE